jgi:hypothetical protein
MDAGTPTGTVDGPETDGSTETQIGSEADGSTETQVGSEVGGSTAMGGSPGTGGSTGAGGAGSGGSTGQSTAIDAGDGSARGGDTAVSEAAAPDASTLQIGLVGHWTFDEGSGNTVLDSSGNGISGGLVNGPTWKTRCAPTKTGGSNAACLHFDGNNQSVTLADAPVSNFAGSISMTAWINTDASRTGLRNVIAHGFTTNPAAEAYLRLQTTRMPWVPLTTGITRRCPTRAPVTSGYGYTLPGSTTAKLGCFIATAIWKRPRPIPRAPSK